MSKPKRQHWGPLFLPPALRDAGVQKEDEKTPEGNELEAAFAVGSGGMGKRYATSAG
jgi:hypothetical protein